VKAAVLHGPGRLVLEEVDDPPCPPDGILMKVLACSICGTDLKMLKNGHRDLSYPRIMGHELVGEVAEIGAEARPLAEVGEAVQVWPGIACGRCQPCLKGWDNHCERIGILGFNRDGGWCEKLALPQESLQTGLILVERSRSEAFSLTEPLACCCNAQESAEVGEDDLVLILGGGPLGCLNGLLAERKGARVVLAEPLASRRRIIGQARAGWRVVDPAEEDLGQALAEESGAALADVIVPAAPQVSVEALLPLAGPKCRISVFCGPLPGEETVRMDMRAVHYGEIVLAGAYGCSSRHNREAARLIASGEIDLDWLITYRAGLDGIGSAIDHAARREGMRATILPQINRR